MKALVALMLLAVAPCGLASARAPVAVPKDIPPVVATAITPSDSKGWSVELTIPEVSWRIVGERRPKFEWPGFKVDVKETALVLSLDYPRASALSDEAQNRIVDLQGKRLTRDEAGKRLKEKTPVLVSISGRMPDAFYLQCMKPDTLIVILGHDATPAPQFLPHEAK